MKGYNKWNFSPYIPCERIEDEIKPYICALRVGKNSVSGEWIDKNFDGKHTVCYAKRGSNAFVEKSVDNNVFSIENLDDGTEYEIYIKNANGEKSNTRLAKVGESVGVVVNYIHPEDTQYAFSGSYPASPSIVRLENGTLLASHDVFKGGNCQNLSIIFRSDDNGESWRYVTDLFPCFWGKMFVHKNELYMIAMSREYGDLLIGKSLDEGKTWTTPTVIMRGSNNCTANGLHKAPMPVVSANGRLWTGIDCGSWNTGMFLNSIFSIDEDADLLDAENWSATPFLRHDKNWKNALDVVGAIEGNAVALDDGTIINMLRYGDGKALMLKTNMQNYDSRLEFHKVIDFPMGHSKFEVQRHKNGLYYAVGNRLPLRNILSVYSSKDLEKWEFVDDILNYEHMPKEEVGFQYPSFCFCENEILVLSRTAFVNAANFHDSNMITFHKISI